MRHRLGGSPLVSLEPPVAMEMDTVFLVVERLLRLGLYLMILVLTVSRIKAAASDSTLPPAAQVKAVRCTGTRLLVHLFTDEVTPTDFWLRGDRLDAVREVCLSTEQLHQLTHNSSVSANGHPLLSLAPLWSRSRDLTRKLLAGPPVKAIADLLASGLSGSGPVAERLMEILANLVFLPEDSTSNVHLKEDKL